MTAIELKILIMYDMELPPGSTHTAYIDDVEHRGTVVSATSIGECLKLGISLIAKERYLEQLQEEEYQRWFGDAKSKD